MSDSFFKVKVWTKLITLGLVILFALVFCVENYSQTASVWFFGTHQMTVLELLAMTFISGVVVTLLARPIYKTLGQISELREKKSPAPLPPVRPAPADDAAAAVPPTLKP